MDKKIEELMKLNGFDFMDSWQDETTGVVTQKFRKFDEDITVEYINNKDNL